MRLGELLKDCKLTCSVSDLEQDVNGIATNSKLVKKGDIFICLNGENFNANDYVEEAIKNGASFVISDQLLANDKIISTSDARESYALISKNYFSRCCDKLKLIAVTGTNGKTTTTNLIGEILRDAGLKVGIIGTEGANYNNKLTPTGFTTPDPYALHSLFKDMYENGVEYVVMEASAHAIELKKLSGIKFEIGVLTNITEDHLDYFKTMDNYSKCKLSFFNKNNMKLAIVCADDDYARTLIDNVDVPLVSYGLEMPSDIFAVNVDTSFDSTKFVCNCLNEVFPIKTNLIGNYNVENSLAGITVARSIGVPSKLLQMSLRYIKPVEGRFNVITCKGINIVIDYAHTPDGLEKVISTARELTKGKVVTLFGCGGNRDRLKRPIMGDIASRLSDIIVITSDNPRFEEPLEIIEEIKKGVSGDYLVIENRKNAIEKAIELCETGDTLIIAGKGGEKYQEIKGEKLPYNDFDVVYGAFRNQISEVNGEQNGNS